MRNRQNSLQTVKFHTCSSAHIYMKYLEPKPSVSNSVMDRKK